MEQDPFYVSPAQKELEYLTVKLESNDIPKTIEDKKFVLSKIKIAAMVTIAVTLIGAGVSFGLQFKQCEST